MMNMILNASRVLLCVSLASYAVPLRILAAERGEMPPEPIQASPPTAPAGEVEWKEMLRRSSSAHSAPEPLQLAQANTAALFESKSWAPPPAPPRPAPAVRADPVPPPFPYVYIGRMEAEGAQPTVYLTKDGNVYSVAAGEVLDGVYRVRDVTTDQIEVTYLPLGRNQQIAFSSIVQMQSVPAQASGPVAAPIETSRVVNAPFPAPIDAQRGRQPAPATAPQAAPVAAMQPQQPPLSTSGAVYQAPTASTAPPLSSGTGMAPLVVSAPTIFGGSAAEPAPAPSGGTATAGAPVAPAQGMGASSAPTAQVTAPAAQSTAVTPPAGAASGGAIPIAPPTMREMPILPPTPGAMVITPPATSGMPMTRPSGSM